jgi:hypothetical protein
VAEAGQSGGAAACADEAGLDVTDGPEPFALPSETVSSITAPRGSWVPGAGDCEITVPAGADCPTAVSKRTVTANPAALRTNLAAFDVIPITLGTVTLAPCAWQLGVG